MKRNSPLLSLCCVLCWLLAATQAAACSTIIVGRLASETGCVIVGHDEDDDEPHLDSGRLAVVPPREHRPGTVLPAEKGCARIPQVRKTHGFYWSEVKDLVKGGMRNADFFVNDRGVLVTSNNGVADAPEDAYSGVLDGGIGYNLRRAIAERANSARDGVTIATNLLQTYGYDMPGRMYTVADAGEAWVVEVVRGRRYVARRCPDDEVTVIANCYTIGSLQPEDILSPAVAEHSKSDPDFAFDRAYQGAKRWRKPVDLLRMKHMYRLAAGLDFAEGMPPFSASPVRRVSAVDVKAALSTHYEGTADACLPRHGRPRCDLCVCRPFTLESTICIFGKDVRATELEVAKGSPCENEYQVFKPFADPLPSTLDRSGDAIQRLETHVYPVTDESGNVVVENARMRLVVGRDAQVRALVLKATEEELLDLRDPAALFSVTQPRPFNNEIKLVHPNVRTTYPANRIRREGNRFVVGFETAPYEAVVEVKVTDDYIAFTLVDFILTEKSYPLCPTTTVPLDFTAPPVDEFRLLELPVRNRANLGEWLNVQWDKKAAVGVFATSPHALVGAERRNGYRLMRADAVRDVKLKGVGAALVVDVGKEAILDRIDALEKDYGLPRGVENRRNPLVNASIYFACGFTPKTADRHIELAKKGGFRLMEISYGSFFGVCGDFRYNKHYPNGFSDVKNVLDKVHAAGILPGLHILHTFVGYDSHLIKGGADRRLLLREHYTLSRKLGRQDAEVFVDENPQNAERMEKCRILKFGKELMSYEGYTTERPYRFYGVKRGVKDTPACDHEEGFIGGTLWVCEYGGYDVYLKPDSDLQDIIAQNVSEFWKAGMRFIYFDGSEGVCPPFGYHVPIAQYRVWKRLDPQPVLGEGAAKAHFGWHMLSGANAFDVFFPEEFKEKIDEFPAAEAPMMRKDFSRVNFGWWGFWAPGDEIRGRTTIGVQPDMWEYGTSKAAAWDCPVSIQMDIERLERHPRLNDILEVMRRWEDVRARRWLTSEMKGRIQRSANGCHLYLNAHGEYEFHEIEMLPSPPNARDLRGFLFERNGKRVVALWHSRNAGTVQIPLGKNGAERALSVSGMQYMETDMSREEAVRAFGSSRMD